MFIFIRRLDRMLLIAVVALRNAEQFEKILQAVSVPQGINHYSLLPVGELIESDALRPFFIISDAI